MSASRMAHACVRQRFKVLYIGAAIKISYIIEWDTAILCIYTCTAVGMCGLLQLLTLD